MRFSLFAHMERYDLAQSQTELLANLVEYAQIAEAGGFETFWTGEHHGMEFTIGPNPLILLTYLASQTSTIRLGTGTVVAPFWHPIRLAGEVALTDLVTGGRLEVAISRGAYQFEFDRLMGGMPGTEGGRNLRELVPALQKLLRGDYAHEGEIWSWPATRAVPHPLQQPYPPIWIAARDPASHEFAVANGCNVQVTPLGKDDDEVDSLVERFNAACAAHPEQPRPQLMLLRHSFVGATEAEISVGTEAIQRFYSYFSSWFANKKPVIDGICPPLTDEELAAVPAYALDVVRRNHLIGTPDEVIGRLKRYEAQGIDEFSIWLDNSADHAAKKAMLELWVREVMPAFRS